GGGVGVRRVGRGRDVGQRGGRDHGRRDQPRGRLRTGGPVQQVSTQQPADLVTGERAPAAGGGGIRDRDGEPVAVRVVRDDQVRGGLARLRQGQIGSPGVLRAGGRVRRGPQGGA